MTVVGITSWGIVPCASENAPSVFAEVAHYRDWIDANAPDLKTCPPKGTSPSPTPSPSPSPSPSPNPSSSISE